MLLQARAVFSSLAKRVAQRDVGAVRKEERGNCGVAACGMREGVGEG